MAEFNTFLIALHYLPEDPELRARARLKDPTLVVAGDQLYELLGEAAPGEHHRVRLLGDLDVQRDRAMVDTFVWVWMQYTDPRHLRIVED